MTQPAILERPPLQSCFPMHGRHMTSTSSGLGRVLGYSPATEIVVAVVIAFWPYSQWRHTPVIRR